MTNNLAILTEIDAEYTRQEGYLRFRHKRANDVYKVIVTLTVAALCLSLYSWALDVWADHRAAAAAATALADYQAEQEVIASAKAAAAAAERQSEEAVIARQSEAVAKMFYGIRLFIEKYHYSERDLETYAWCAFNRYDAGGGMIDLEAIIGRKDQFTGYSEKNSVLKEYLVLAEKFVRDWHTQTVRPCDASYQYAELTPTGIYLVAEYGANGYARRWHA